MIILLMGPQGSGKGTQGEMLSKKMGIPLVSTGGMLREVIASGSELGKEIEVIINGGNLVSPELATKVIAERIKKDDAVNGILIDGYPRDAEQLEMMFEHFRPDIALVLDISDEEALKRLGGRWICPDGHIWNINSNPTKIEGVCDEDGLALTQRDDDTGEAILKRLAIYRADTEPLIEGLRGHDVEVVRIDASGGIDDVQELLVGALKLDK